MRVIGKKRLLSCLLFDWRGAVVSLHVFLGICVRICLVHLHASTQQVFGSLLDVFAHVHDLLNQVVLVFVVFLPNFRALLNALSLDAQVHNACHQHVAHSLRPFSRIPRIIQQSLDRLLEVFEVTVQLVHLRAAPGVEGHAFLQLLSLLLRLLQLGQLRPAILKGALLLPADSTVQLVQLALRFILQILHLRVAKIWKLMRNLEVLCFIKLNNFLSEYRRLSVLNCSFECGNRRGDILLLLQICISMLWKVVDKVFS